MANTWFLSCSFLMKREDSFGIGCREFTSLTVGHGPPHRTVGPGKAVAGTQRRPVPARSEGASREVPRGERSLSGVVCGVKLSLCCAREN